MAKSIRTCPGEDDRLWVPWMALGGRTSQPGEGNWEGIGSRRHLKKREGFLPTLAYRWVTYRDQQNCFLLLMRKMKPWTVVLLTGVFLTAPLTVSAQNTVKSEKAKPYPLDVCAVSGEALGGDQGEPYVFVSEGREIQLCCKSCLEDFEKNKTKILAKVDAAAKKVKPYKLETCLVSGDKFGEMGEPFVFIRKGQEIKLCCKGCLKDFNKDQAAYLKKLEAK